MSSLSVEYLIKVKMVKLLGDDSKYEINHDGFPVFRKVTPQKNGLIIKPKKNMLNRPSLIESLTICS